MLTHFYADHIDIDAGVLFPVIQIVNLELNKARGIEQVRQFFKHSTENNIIVFGDEDNDIEMIEY